MCLEVSNNLLLVANDRCRRLPPFLRFLKRRHGLRMLPVQMRYRRRLTLGLVGHGPVSGRK
jgi:hypothetical protein